jgi:hypothetical protein
MFWLVIAVLAGIAFLLFKFIVKPLFKVVGIVILALIAWWIFKSF